MQDLGRLLQRVVHAIVGRKPMLDQLALLGAWLFQLEQGVAIEAIAAVGGHPAGRGVRLLEVPELFQLGHHVAHRRRGDVELRLARELRAAHRVARGDVLLNHCPEDVALAVAEVIGHLDVLQLTCAWDWRGAKTSRR